MNESFSDANLKNGTVFVLVESGKQHLVNQEKQVVSIIQKKAVS
jgi:predicted Holliday junction resolvase-like endonuclease